MGYITDLLQDFSNSSANALELLVASVLHKAMNMVFVHAIPDSKVHEANMGPSWVLSAPAGPHVGPMNLAIKDVKENIPSLLPW